MTLELTHLIYQLLLLDLAGEGPVGGLGWGSGGGLLHGLQLGVLLLLVHELLLVHLLHVLLVVLLLQLGDEQLLLQSHTHKTRSAG